MTDSPCAPWAGQMSVPRELSLRDGKLCQKPVRELDSCRTTKTEYRDVVIMDTERELEGINGRVVDILIRIRPAADEMYHSFEMRFAQNDAFYTSLRFTPESGILEIDRYFSGATHTILNKAQCLVDSDAADLHLRILLDRYSAEVFIEDGHKVMTATMYTEESADRISFHAEGAVVMEITKYDIKL